MPGAVTRPLQRWLFVCHQYRRMCMHCPHHSCQPKAAISAPTALTHLWLLCFGRSGTPTAAWVFVGLLENQPVFFPHSFPMLSQWGASIFLSLLLEECMSLLMLRSSQPVVQNRWNYKSLLSGTEKGERQKEANASECQAQWGLGELPSSFLQFVKSLVDFSTAHSLYLINNT